MNFDAIVNWFGPISISISISMSIIVWIWWPVRIAAGIISPNNNTNVTDNITAT